MKRGLIAFMLVFPLLSLAHEEDLLVAVETSVDIKVSKQKVWDVVSRFDDLSWFENVKSVSVPVDQSASMFLKIRYVTLANGHVLKETIVDWIDKDSFAYRIENLPFKRYFIELNLYVLDAETTRVRFNGYGKVIPEGMKAMGFQTKDEFQDFIQNVVYGKSLKNLKVLLEKS